MFASRTHWQRSSNRLAERAAARRSAHSLLDLTQTNPTRVGFRYERDRILAALGQAAALVYDPQPLGIEMARRAVADYYAARGVAAPPERILLTASTSEAYGHLFRLLCNPGDEVLAPAPSYPLFDLLAGLSDVRLRFYPMLYDQAWQLDLHALERAVGERTRAILLVHPNNPTGSYLQPAEWRELRRIAVRRGLALIVDEVFFDFPILPGAAHELNRDGEPLLFVLNGLSKLTALPQMKLGWMVVHGAAPACREALERLEIINDTFLSAAAPVQVAAAELLASRVDMQTQIRSRLCANLARLDAALACLPAVERLRVEGGWSCILRLPRTRTDEEWAELLLERAGVLTHPGHFYNLNAEAHLVISLLPPEAEFAAAMAGIAAALAPELG